MTNQSFFRIIVFLAFCFLLLLSSMNAQDKKSQVFTLTDGLYEMRATYKFSDQNVPTVDFGGTITVTVKNKELSILVPIFKQPIVMKLNGNIFKGKMQNEGASIEFQGEIVENNHTEGVFFGSFGEKKVTGIWTMKFLRKQSSQEKST